MSLRQMSQNLKWNEETVLPPSLLLKNVRVLSIVMFQIVLGIPPVNQLERTCALGPITLLGVLKFLYS